MFHFQGEGDFTVLEVGNPSIFTLQGRNLKYNNWMGTTWHIGLAFGNPQKNLSFHVSKQKIV